MLVYFNVDEIVWPVCSFM